VGECVVISAEECEIARLGLTAVHPVLEMVDVAPARTAIATIRPGAVTVTGDDGPAQTGRDDPGTSADVEDVALWAEYDPAH
jgi:hypothetical protein